jgi:hypothetical protein
MAQTKDNTTEVSILMQLSSMVIRKATPHFPIMYYNFTCNVPSKNSKLPKFANDKNYFVNINELANGDLSVFIQKEYQNYKLATNALAQIFISILTLHKIGCSHNDAHWGNFLFHRITPGGYIKYMINSKEVFVENLGYLWVIWDYGKISVLDKTEMLPGIIDYNRVIHSFVDKNRIPNAYLPHDLPVTEEMYKLVRSIIDMYYDILYEEKMNANFNPLKRTFDDIFFDRLLDRTNLFSRQSELPPGAKIINKFPYIVSA